MDGMERALPLPIYDFDDDYSTTTTTERNSNFLVFRIFDIYILLYFTLPLYFFFRASDWAVGLWWFWGIGWMGLGRVGLLGGLRFFFFGWDMKGQDRIRSAGVNIYRDRYDIVRSPGESSSRIYTFLTNFLDF
jgi:hypothetical protein